MLAKLTRLQEQVMHYICQFASEQGFPPSYAEMATHFNFSSDGTIRTYLEHLEKKGYIQRLGKARGIKILVNILEKARPSIPILGHIAAGAPIAAIEHHQGTLEELAYLQPKEGRIALKVQGNSMVDAGIFDGDIAIIQTGVPVPNGQIGAISVDEETTLKRIFYEGDRVKLQPENAAYTPMYLDKYSFKAQILGRYIALVRSV